jgi:hypothetical protein
MLCNKARKIYGLRSSVIKLPKVCDVEKEIIEHPRKTDRKKSQCMQGPGHAFQSEGDNRKH